KPATVQAASGIVDTQTIPAPWSVANTWGTGGAQLGTTVAPSAAAGANATVRATGTTTMVGAATVGTLLSEGTSGAAIQSANLVPGATVRVAIDDGAAAGSYAVTVTPAQTVDIALPAQPAPGNTIVIRQEMAGF